MDYGNGVFLENRGVAAGIPTFSSAKTLVLIGVGEGRLKNRKAQLWTIIYVLYIVRAMKLRGY